jgi:molybdopterin synthase catalytic subunit
MIAIVSQPIATEEVINSVRTPESGGVIVYTGLIRDNSRGKAVRSVTYSDPEGQARESLEAIVTRIKSKFPVNDVAICHRIGQLKIGEINIVVAVAAAHRQEGFAACMYAIDQFKENLPTHKVETYADGSTYSH